MIKTENECVQCPDGLPCIGSTCPCLNVSRVYCDKCHDEISGDNEVYFINDGHYCEDCANEYIEDWWNNLLMQEKADTLNILYYEAGEIVG